MYRYFEFENDLLGAEVFVAASTGWAGVQGMTLANGRLYHATTGGNLNRVAFVGGAPSGSSTVVSGPGVDGVNWASRGLFVFAA